MNSLNTSSDTERLSVSWMRLASSETMSRVGTMISVTWKITCSPGISWSARRGTLS